MSQQRTSSDEATRGNRKVALIFSCVALGMLGMSYAAVPLYQIFCQVTGYGGTTQRAAAAPTTVLDRTITVRFDANVSGLPWKFEPVVRRMDVRIGENSLAFYRATNISAKPSTGTASFNVTPEITGGFFNKLACFCFTEQTLAPGESIDMPVSFFVDPTLVDDKDATKVSEITLSYTFYPAAKPRTEAKVGVPEARGTDVNSKGG